MESYNIRRNSNIQNLAPIQSEYRSSTIERPSFASNSYSNYYSSQGGQGAFIGTPGLRSRNSGFLNTPQKTFGRKLDNNRSFETPTPARPLLPSIYSNSQNVNPYNQRHATPYLDRSAQMESHLQETQLMSSMIKKSRDLSNEHSFRRKIELQKKLRQAQESQMKLRKQLQMRQNRTPTKPMVFERKTLLPPQDGTYSNILISDGQDQKPDVVPSEQFGNMYEEQKDKMEKKANKTIGDLLDYEKDTEQEEFHRPIHILSGLPLYKFNKKEAVNQDLVQNYEKRYEAKKLLRKTISLQRRVNELSPYQKFRSIAKSIFYWTILYISAKKYAKGIKETLSQDIEKNYDMMHGVTKEWLIKYLSSALRSAVNESPEFDYDFTNVLSLFNKAAVKEK